MKITRWLKFILLISGIFLLVAIAPRIYALPAVTPVSEKPKTADVALTVDPGGVTKAQVATTLPRVEQLTEELMRKTGVPRLAIAVVHKDEVVYSKGFGVRETGKPDLVDENLTSSHYVDFERSEKHASGHVLIDGRWVAKYRRQPDAESPAGAVSSTVVDLAQWMVALDDTKLIFRPISS